MQITREHSAVGVLRGLAQAQGKAELQALGKGCLFKQVKLNDKKCN